MEAQYWAQITSINSEPPYNPANACIPFRNPNQSHFPSMSVVVMAQLTAKVWNELCKAQEERDAHRRELIRQAVATSAIPWPPELFQAVIQLAGKDTHTVLSEHPGFALAERRNSYRTSLAIMEQSLQDLLAAISSFEAEALAEGSTLFSSQGRAALQAVERRIQKELFTTANAAASLVDHSRRMQKLILLPDYAEQLKLCFGTDGLHEFVIALRVMLHHIHIVEAGWSRHKDYFEGTSGATFIVHKDALLRVIAGHQKRFGRPADKRMQVFVNAASDTIDIRALFIDYRARMAKFYRWLDSQLASESFVTLRDYDRILQERKNHGSRMSWNVLLGNWLRNWKVPPNPHDHLHKFLTPEQMDDIYKLPRNSKAQVDLVISYVDEANAIDESLRQQAYELFERSPPPEDAPLARSA